MRIKLEHLEKLNKDMVCKGETRVVFHAHHRGHFFSCIFLSDIQPYRLYVSALEKLDLTLEFEVSESFFASACLKQDDFVKLVAYLEIKFNPESRFLTSDFLSELLANCIEKGSKAPRGFQEPRCEPESAFGPFRLTC